MTDKEILEEMKEWHFADEELHQFQIEWLFEQVEEKLALEGKLIVIEENLNHTAYFLEQERKEKRELERLINTHEPHGRNYTNEQYVKLRLNLNRYHKAVKKIEQSYESNSKKYPSEYESGYLDGLDRALGILEEVEELK